MLEPRRAKIAAAFILALAGIIAVPAMAQSKSGGKFVCWKDKTGKVVGCGDTVPPEYRDNAGSQLDRSGVKRGALESAEEAARRRAQEEATAKQKAEEKRRLAEQQRLDAALLNTYANEKEIDQRRDRELQQFDLTITQLQAPLKNATDRYDEAKKRNAKEDMARAAAEKEKFEREIAAKQKEKAELAERYDAQKKRYAELRGGGQSAAAVPASAPAPKQKK
jgi:phage-related minor tail protein